MSDETAILSLPYILPAQAQKHVTHNTALQALDLAVQLAVTDRGSPTPPAGPAEGARHIVGAGAISSSSTRRAPPKPPACCFRPTGRAGPRWAPLAVTPSPSS
jgi:hypothetical protein